MDVWCWMVVNGASTTLFIGTLLGYKVGIELDLTNKKYFFLCHVLRCHPYKWDDDDSQRGGFSITKEWLVGGLEHFIFFHILGIIIPTDFHIFQRGWNHQPVMYRNSHVEYSSQEIHPFSIHVFFPLDENSSVIPQFFIQFRTPLVPAVAQFWAIFIQGAPKG